MKYCLDCNLLKPIAEFCKNVRKKDGHEIYCRPCASVRSKEQYQKSKDKVYTRHKVWVSNNREKMAAYCKEWRERNPELNAQIHHDHYIRNRERLLLGDKLRRLNNYDKFIEREQASYEKFRDNRRIRAVRWRTKNPHKVTAHAAKRRSVKKQRTPPWMTEDHFNQIDMIYAMSDVMTKSTGVQHHVDHIVPLQGKTVSGLHAPWNMQVIPATDNLRKNNKLIGVNQ